MAGRIEVDDSGRTVLIHEVSSAHERGVVEACKELQAAGMTGSSEMRYYGEVTPHVLQSYCDRTGVTWDQAMQNPEHFRRILNDPENAHLRVWKGRI